MNSHDIRVRLQSAFIPQQAFQTTLQAAGQTALRSFIEDKMYQSNGFLKSISLLQPRGMPSVTFDTVCARFAAEMCIVGQPVLHVGVRTIAREIERYAHGGSAEDALHPVLSHSGFLYVTGIDEGEPSHIGAYEYLLDHASRGGALLLPRSFSRERFPDARRLYAPLDSFLMSSHTITLHDTAPGAERAKNV